MSRGSLPGRWWPCSIRGEKVKLARVDGLFQSVKCVSLRSACFAAARSPASWLTLEWGNESSTGSNLISLSLVSAI